MINHFTFNGTSTAQLGLIVSGVSIFGAGSRKVEKARIPGRNGDLQIELGGFNNYTVRYTVSITNNFTTTAQQIREWLLESKGYCDLTDTYHPDEIRKACFNSDIEFTTSMLYKYGQASIQFDCLPERYLTTNTPITTTATADTTTDTTMSLSTVPTPINISLNGNTTQEGSSGKNLIPRPYYQADGTYQGVTWTTDNMGKITGSGTTTAGTNFRLTNNTNFTLRAGTYTLSITGTLTGIGLKVYNGSAIIREILRGATNGHTTFTLSSAVGIRIYFNTGNTGDSVNVSAYVQLEQGSTATTYEPHISPTNPQVIHSVSGDNVVAISGKNIISGEFMADKLVKEVANSNACYKTEDEHGKCLLFTSSNDIRNGVILDTFKPNTRYTVIGREQNATTTGSGANIIVSYTDGTYEFIFLSTSGVTTGTVYDWTFNTASGKSVKSISLYNHHSGNRKLYYEHFGIFEGANATFEPYTRQSYPLYLPVENLLPTFNATSGTSNGVTYSSDGSKIYLNGTSTGGVSIVFTVNGVLPSSEFYLCLFNNVINNNVAFVIDNGNTTVLSLSLGTETNRKQKYTTYYGETYTRVRVYINSAGQVFNNAVLMPMITYTPTVHYTPYGTTPIELNKIGTYQDYIYKNGGKWYVHKEIGKQVVNYAPTGSGTSTTGAYRYAVTSQFKSYTEANVGLSSHFLYNVNYNAPSGCFYNSTSTIIFFCDIAQADITRWVQANQPTFYGVLSTPTNTEITDTTLINQLNNIEKAYSYNGTTNILQVSNDNPFVLEVVSLHGSTFNSNYKGEPIITVNSTGLIYLNGEVMEVLSAPVTINCQTMQCYNGVVNMNNEVRVNDFPEIKIGSNEVGSSMALTITPNNWRH